MTVSRLCTAVAAVLTAMLLQATVVGPVAAPRTVSVTLVVVLAVAVLCGPSAGISLGFGTGLVLDLCSRHPVGVLAAVWLGAGLVGGVLGGLAHGLRMRVLLIGALALSTGVVSTVALGVLGAADGPVPGLLLQTFPGAALDTALALVVVPIAAAMLRSPSLRPPPTAPRPPAPAPRLPMNLRLPADLELPTGVAPMTPRTDPVSTR